MIVNNPVKFRLLRMPCCGTLLCHVNARLPNYCPECGTLVHAALLTGDCTLISDETAWLKYNTDDVKPGFTATQGDKNAKANKSK
jgi:hypothetical protein